jgi:hypothetical protein
LRLKLSTDDDARLARLPVLRAGGNKMASLSAQSMCGSLVLHNVWPFGRVWFRMATTYRTQRFDKWAPDT